MAEEKVKIQKEPRIGFAIGGGAAKALVQYGILKRLYKANIRPSIIMGTSMGAIVGAMFASGLNLSKLENTCFAFFKKHHIGDLNNINIFNDSLYKENFTEVFLKELFNEMTFDDCLIPFSVTAVDLESGELQILNKGPLWKSLLASTAIPGVFNPVFLDKKYLVDGGLLADSPIAPLRDNPNCDLVIGSRIYDYNDRQAIAGLIYEKFYKTNSSNKKDLIKSAFGKITVDTKVMFQIIFRSITILREELFKYQIRDSKPDLFIEVEMSETEAFAFQDLESILAKGERIMEERLPELLELIEKKKKEL